MLTEYLNRLNELSPLSIESKNLLLEHIFVKKINAGDYILKQGDVCKHIYFVNKGFVRIFYYKNGKNITEWFSKEKSFFFSIASYFNETESNLVIETLEDSEIIFLSKAGLEKFRKTNLEIANLLIELFSGSLIFSQQRMESIQFETAKDRYQNLLNEQPGILNKVPLHHLATFLGITQETLSRIRAKV
ncbi:Crp/Fnr family transcriptional regulator [Lutibacter flavus]|uniref:cAMP-binding domain of CRP or a regulatory subunit of cAMP-dependent protein kinases n=1 Tax=Lutibacter flavus TaxID=691689 RepID=A0A238VLK7_9FLAO|nr:Crp/Fnr family transcriptional regulator [Lutibacter flavus]SNR35088.1 cAMP-binding domain of CRP or a regulatory subunit of cAMP-dependent protein kinases [Lutibacter flavus]